MSTAIELPPAAQADPDCPHCRGDGYQAYVVEEATLARQCTCLETCRRCNDTGRVVVETEQGTRVGRCRCQMIPDRIAIFNQAGIPARYLDATIESFARGAGETSDQQKFQSFTEVSQWLGRFDHRVENRGLILYGLVGRGKTHLLVALLRTLIFTTGIPCRFIEFSRLLSLLKKGYSEGRSDAQLLNELATVPVLGIDEIGKGRLTEWELAIIDEVVSRRYNAMACTLGTTNYAPQPPTGSAPLNMALGARIVQSMGDRVGERVFSRFRQMSDFIEIRGIDFRDHQARTARRR